MDINLIMWTLEDGLIFARSLEPLAIANGAHVALGGSVLFRGSSTKDIDILIYPHSAKVGIDRAGFEKTLLGFGITEWSERTQAHYQDTKEVWMAMYQSKRVDFFFMK